MTDPKIIKIKIKCVYGRDLWYPANDTGKIFAKMLGVKTFNKFQINCLKELNYTITMSDGILSGFLTNIKNGNREQ
jgi:hypothetical protein